MRLALIFLAFALACPAWAADYLIFAPGRDEPIQVYHSDEPPVMGKQAPADCTFIEWSMIDGVKEPYKYRMAAGKLTLAVEPPLPPLPETTYADKREAEYARLKLGDQLDAIYKAALQLGIKPDATQPADTPEGWTGRIQAIKEKYPKPE